MGRRGGSAIHKLIKRTIRPQERAAAPAYEQAERPDAPPPSADRSDNSTEAIVERAKAAASARRQQSQVRRCLVVDDSRMIRKVARRIVEGLGYEVGEAENGEEALARCRSTMPHLIILDWNMPVMSGLEFVASLREVPGNEIARVVFCTSNSGAVDIHKGIDAGADEYVIKPFDEATLVAKLERLGVA